MAADGKMARSTQALQRSSVAAKMAAELWGQGRSRAGAANCQKKGYVWKRMRVSPATPKNLPMAQAKKLDWEMLKLWAASGILQLLYLDECGCCCQSPTDYSYSLLSSAESPISTPPTW